MPSRDRAFFEKREQDTLAPYAMKAAESRGRLRDEPEHAFRVAFQRDRDRIIHSSAFRRLEYKTQVFVNHEGDYYRTRLTHTMEAAQITRTIAGALGLNQDLAEAVALAHDLGHTPFGHAGEHVLASLMDAHGGFDHNSQSLRIVEVLEEKYPEFVGLNLTYEVREGIVKHSTSHNRPRLADFSPSEAPLLEAQIVDFADEIAYNSHDIDDGLQSALIGVEDLEGVTLWDTHFREVVRRHPAAGFSVHRYQTVRRILDTLVTELINSAERAIAAQNIDSVAAVRAAKPRIIDYTPETNAAVIELKARLMDRLYQHHRVRRMTAKAARVMRGLFEAYMEDPHQMPPHVVSRATGRTSMPRVIADYVAGMTDRFALDEHAKLYDPNTRV
jgi:dGTPase